MSLDFQYVFNLGIMALVGVSTYLFNVVQTLKERVQALEDVHTIKLDDLIKKVDKLELSNEKMEQKLNELSHNIHKEKNTEHQLTQAINLLIKKIDNEAN
jgi:hypothetical protein